MGIIKKKSLKHLEEKASESRSLPMAVSVSRKYRKTPERKPDDKKIPEHEYMADHFAKGGIVDDIMRKRVEKANSQEPARELDFADDEGVEFDTYDMRNMDAAEEDEAENYAFGGEVNKPSLEELNKIAGSSEDEGISLSDKIRRRMLSRRGV